MPKHTQTLSATRREIAAEDGYFAHPHTDRAPQERMQFARRFRIGQDGRLQPIREEAME
jgi:hypothetical protein